MASPTWEICSSFWRKRSVMLIRGEAVYVQDLEELLAFIERRTGKVAVPDRPAAWLR